MANISDKVAQIRQAVYGKDVRESIASGIEAINDEVEAITAKQTSLETTFQQLIINAGNSNAEIVDARVKANNTVYPTLRDRLNDIDTQLAEKANQTDLDNINLRVTNLENNKADKAALDNINSNLASIDAKATEALNKANSPLAQIPDNSIPSSKLKQATDADKIHIANLGNDVIAAITGQSPAGTVPADGSVTTEKIANGAVTLSKIDFSDAPILTLYGPIVANYATGKITIPNGIIIQKGYPFKQLKASDYGLSKFEFNIQTGFVLDTIVLNMEKFRNNEYPFEVYTLAEVPTYRNTNIIILSTIYNKVFTQFPLEERNIPGRLGVDGQLATVVGDAFKINIDTVNKKLQLIQPRYQSFVFVRDRFNSIKQGDFINNNGIWEKDISNILDKDGIGGLFVDDSGNLSILQWDGGGAGSWVTPLDSTKNQYPIVLWYNNPASNRLSVFAGCATVNNLYNFGGFIRPYALFVGRDYINFDFDNAKITIPDGYILYRDIWYTPDPKPQVVDITDTGDGIQGLYFDVSTKKFVVARYTEFGSKGITNNYNLILIAGFWANGFNKVFAPMPVKINGKLPWETKFNESTQRLLLPDKMFFIKNGKLPLYKSSIISSGDNLETFKTALINVAPDGTPSYKYFYEDLELNEAELSNSFKIAVKPNTDNSKIYYKTITKVAVDVATKASKSPKILCIGDSLTNRNIPAYLKQKLSSYGINATMVGTMINNGGERGEGREGWTFKNFIGKDNIHLTGTTITRLESGDTSTLYQNPFLKLADSNDIANHPDWCFRNTGSNVEKSYAEDTDKTGNFYIFDFAWYLANHNVPTPDVVTIALSTNDIWQDDAATALANSRLGLEIMVKQIKAALPNVKIGIIPAPAWGSTSTGDSYWANQVATWIENCITDVASWGMTDVFIVPIWAHMNRDFIYPYSSENNLSNINNSKVATRSEYVHWGEEGKWQYVNAMAAFVINVI